MNIFDLKRKWIALQERWKKTPATDSAGEAEDISNEKYMEMPKEDGNNDTASDVKEEGKEEWAKHSSPNPQQVNGEKPIRKSKIGFNVVGLFRAMKKDWWIPTACTVAFAVLGIWAAFQIPRIYKANVMLAPETANNNMLSGVSSLASMVGLYNDANPTGDAIYPEIYPDLMSSNDFIIGLFDIPVETLDKSVHTTYYDYLRHHQKQPWWSKQMESLTKYIGKKFIKKKEISRGDSTKVNPFELTKDQFNIVSSIKGDIACSVDKKTNVINIEVTSQDPLVSATMADSVKKRLQVYITRYRTSKARNDLKYMERLFLEAKKNYEDARKKYAVFSDANTDIVLESIRSQQEDLENDMQLKYNIYTQLVQQLQMARAKLQERVPAFTVVQSATVPVKHANTPKIYILAVFLFLGWAIALTALIIKRRREIIVIINE